MKLVRFDHEDGETFVYINPELVSAVVPSVTGGSAVGADIILAGGQTITVAADIDDIADQLADDIIESDGSDLEDEEDE